MGPPAPIETNGSAVSAAGRAEPGLHPAAWMVWATGAGLVAFSTTDPFYLGLLVAISWFVYAERRQTGPAARSFRIFAMAGLVAMLVRTALVVFDTVHIGSIVFAALEGARLAALLVAFGTFNAVTDPFGVLRLAPRRFHEPALAAALALSIAPRTVASVHRVREAQAIRGLRARRLRSLPALAVPVLATGIEEAMTLAESMDARGHGRGTRSRYRPQAWTGPGVVVVAAAIPAAGAFLVASFGGLAQLHPSTFPLRWPRAEPWLLAAEGLLAVPALVGRRRR
jgi:energy-coupling factor transport system permease protein